MPKKILCKDCFFFEFVSSKDPKTGAVLLAPEPGEVSAGFCRRYPPVVLGDSTVSITITRTHDWCGEAIAIDANA